VPVSPKFSLTRSPLRAPPHVACTSTFVRFLLRVRAPRRRSVEVSWRHCIVSPAVVGPGVPARRRERQAATLDTTASWWLKATLVRIAWPAVRRRDSYFHASFHRQKARRGPKKAIRFRLPSSLPRLLRDGTVYEDLGAGHFHPINRDRTAKSRAQPRLSDRSPSGRCLTGWVSC
jgi:hypothetical protein